MSGALQNFPGGTDERARKVLTAFVSRALLGLGEGGTGGIKLEIRDTGEDGRKDFLDEYALSASTPADQVALQIHHKAQEEADGTGRGLHHFNLKAYRSRENVHFAATSFILEAQNAPEEERGTASARSLLEQAQRHNEAMMRLFVQAQAQQQHAQSTMLASVTERLAGFEQVQLAMFRQFHQNTVDHATLTFDIETKRKMVAMFEALGPVAIAELMPLVRTWVKEKTEPPEAIAAQSVLAPAPAQIAAVAAPPKLESPEPPAPQNGHAKEKKRRPRA